MFKVIKKNLRSKLHLGSPLYTYETHLKYIGGLHSYLRHTILMLNPTNINEALVQAIHLEASKRKNGFEDVLKKPQKLKKWSKGK